MLAVLDLPTTMQGPLLGSMRVGAMAGFAAVAMAGGMVGTGSEGFVLVAEATGPERRNAARKARRRMVV